MSADLPAVVGAFRVPGELVSWEAWGSGHINETYCAITRNAGGVRRTLLQRINHRVFADPRQVTTSIARVTAHVRAKLAARGVVDLERRVMTLIETKAGEVCLRREEDDSWWRALVFLDGAQSFDQPTSPAMVRSAARAFGAFQQDLSDLPPPRLPETIPHFHDTPRRVAAFRRAVAADVAGRAPDAAPEIDFAESRASMQRVLLDAHESGDVPERVTHNDTKLNNVLFDEATGDALCVIDLDTVMPGLGLYDFGDLVRTCTCAAPEDETDLSRVHADRRLFEALADGYLDAMGDRLTAVERDLLAFSGRLITYQIGLRFLTDHLEGDAYFRVHREAQNLDRARAQFALLRSLEAQDDAFRRLTRR